MLVGHFAAAMVAKRVEPRISLGTAALAAMLADFVAFILLIAGVERFSPPAYIPYSHGLLTLAICGVVFAGAYFLRRGVERVAWILFALVLSHWVLDAISHPPDMALVPGCGPLIGLGLWSSMPATLAVEGGFWVVALVIYSRASRARNWAGRYVFWIVAALLTYIWVVNIRAGTDPNPARAGIGGFLVFGLMVAWTYWMNRARPVDVSSR
jgi:Co/Zn/Cd efflux system component